MFILRHVLSFVNFSTLPRDYNLWSFISGSTIALCQQPFGAWDQIQYTLLLPGSAAGNIESYFRNSSSVGGDAALCHQIEGGIVRGGFSILQKSIDWGVLMDLC